MRLTRNKRLDFGGDPGHNPDPKGVPRISHWGPRPKGLLRVSRTYSTQLNSTNHPLSEWLTRGKKLKLIRIPDP